MLEAIDLCQQIAGRELTWEIDATNRIGDHRWWISDLEPFKRDHPQWDITYDVHGILRQIHEQNAERWVVGT
jgi:CDP-paratose 2-epimerase